LIPEWKEAVLEKGRVVESVDGKGSGSGTNAFRPKVSCWASPPVSAIILHRIDAAKCAGITGLTRSCCDWSHFNKLKARFALGE
jgi:hypothetical protein